MRGIGGPLLCIGDLLGDVGESDTSDSRHDQTLKSPPSPSSSDPDHLHFQPSDLSKLFQNERGKEGIYMRSGMGLRCVQLKEVTASSTVSCSGYWCLWASCGPGENVENANLLAFFCDRNDLSHALENYDQLNKALSGTDHSWTSLTLKLCTALDTAKKLIESTNSNVMVLSERVGELEKVIKMEDSAIAEVRSIHSLLSQRIASSNDSQA